jgi:nucleoside-diphosphate-sugar epimerase
MNILVTGASGFIGGHLAFALMQKNNVKVTVTMRKRIQFGAGCAVHYAALSATTDWSETLMGQNVVVHAAAHAHDFKDVSSDTPSTYRSVNVDGTLNLAQQAASAGVKRFIFVSSIKVNGEFSEVGDPIKAHHTPKPVDDYGCLKLEAENGLLKIASETGLEVVIIRPPLVYGPGVKGNFRKLTQLIRLGVPLPFSSIKNCRSLVAIDNLVNLFITCIEHPNAANEIFLVSDDNDLSTTDLLQKIAHAMDQPLRLFPCPTKLLVVTAQTIGKKNFVDRLMGTLQVDISKTQSLLGWLPPVKVEEGLKRCFSKPHD